MAAHRKTCSFYRFCNGMTTDCYGDADCCGHYWARLVTCKRMMPWSPWSLCCNLLNLTTITGRACLFREVHGLCFSLKGILSRLHEYLLYLNQADSHSFMKHHVLTTRLEDFTFKHGKQLDQMAAPWTSVSLNWPLTLLFLCVLALSLIVSPLILNGCVVCRLLTWTEEVHDLCLSS